MYTILLINGPNLNLLGEREPEIYGSLTLAEIVRRATDHASARGARLISFQSNCEGTIIDRIHEARTDCDALIINPGAYASSPAIGDAIRSVRLATVEVHLSNVYAREHWRQISSIAPAARGQICGFGWYGYILAIDALTAELDSN